jgi:thioredoxin reductase (NADPH)
VIIGSGPAGLTAAIYAARADLAPLVLEGEPSSNSDQPGGQLMLTTDVENYPGFPEGIMGPMLMVDMRTQAARFGAEIETVKASRVDLSARPIGIWVGDPDIAEPTHTADSVIISTGARSLMLNLEAEQRLIGHGLSTCATCDGFFFRDQDVVVIGGGDSAAEESTFLTRFASKVHLLVRRDEMRASKIMAKRVFDNDKIQIHWNTGMTDVLGEKEVEGITTINHATGAVGKIDVTGVFLAIGHTPNSKPFVGFLDHDDSAYLKTAPDSTATNVPGFFACGDVQDRIYRQAVTAAGSGCMAALEAERWLESKEEGS